jgi:hypothetical protein
LWRVVFLFACVKYILKNPLCFVLSPTCQILVRCIGDTNANIPRVDRRIDILQECKVEASVPWPSRI